MNIRKFALHAVSATTFFSVAAQSSGTASSNAATLAHETYGAGPEKVLVLHSWMGDARSFNAIKPYLDTETYTYVFADLRGYGQSRDITGEYTAEEVSRDAVHLADQLGWPHFHVIAHSMSGMIVQRMILDDVKRGKRRIKSAVAITPVTADGFPADDQTHKFLWDLIHQEGMTEQGVSSLTGQRLLPRWSKLVARYNLDTSSAEAMRGYYKMWIETDFSAEVASAKPDTPIRVIGGRQDLPGFSETKYRETFGAWYPNVDFQFITDAGHFPIYETPVYLATLIEAFLQAHRDAAPSQMQ
jgi:pimeloyl-ACP methyl ester carboxylesterase